MLKRVLNQTIAKVVEQIADSCEIPIKGDSYKLYPNDVSVAHGNEADTYDGSQQ